MSTPVRPSRKEETGARKSLFCLPADERRKFFRSAVARTRAAKLMDLLVRPPLLFNPVFNIQLPFNRRVHSPLRRVALRQRGRPADPDPCLLSLDGYLDLFYALDGLVRHFDTSDDSTSAFVARSFLKRMSASRENLDVMRVGCRDFTVGEHIGNGACGRVRVVRERHPPHRVLAMKSQQKDIWLYHEQDGQQILLERTVLAQAALIANPWLPHLHYAFQDERELHLVMDYEPGGDMYIYLTKAGQFLDVDMIRFYAAEAIESVHSLHRMGYIHCDIKPENLAIERSGHLKLLDFGSAIRLDPDGRCICPTMVGTKEYLNVELLSQRESDRPILVGPEYDYWAIGVFIYEMFYGVTPFFDDDEDRMMSKIRRFSKTLSFPASPLLTPDAEHLIRSLITLPANRLTYPSITDHPFFRGVDFSTLRSRTPVYIPDVASEGDCSKFADNAKQRPRDEAITDLHSNKTISSPSRAVGTEVETEEQSTTEQTRADLIKAAVSKPNDEELPEIEEVEWEGERCLRDLPFIGFSFTPGLVRDQEAVTQPDPSANPSNRSRTLLDLNETVTGGGGGSVLEKSLADCERSCLVVELRQRVQNLMRQCDYYRRELDAARQTGAGKAAVDSASGDAPNEAACNLASLLQKHAQLIEDSEDARRVKLEAERLEDIVSRLTKKVSTRPLVAEDVLRYLPDEENGTNVNRLTSRVLSMILLTVDKQQREVDRLAELNGQLVKEKAAEGAQATQKINHLNEVVIDLTSSYTKMDRDRCDKEAKMYRTIEALKIQLDDIKDERSRLHERYDEYAGKYFAVKDELSETRRENERLHELETRETELRDQFDRERHQLESERDELHRQLTVARVEVANLVQLQQRDAKALSELKVSTSDLRARNEDLDKRLSEAEQKCNLDSDQLINNLTEELAMTKHRLDSSEQEVMGLTYREQRARADLASVQKTLDTAFKENEAMRQQLARLTAATGEPGATSGMDDREAELQRLREQVDTAESRSDQMQAQLERSKAHNAQLCHDRDMALNDLHQLRYEYESLDEHFSNTRAAYAGEVEKLKQTVEQQAKLVQHMRTLVPEDKLLGKDHQPSSSASGTHPLAFFRKPSAFFGRKTTPAKPDQTLASDRSEDESVQPRKLRPGDKSRSMGRILRFRLHNEVQSEADPCSTTEDEDAASHASEPCTLPAKKRSALPYSKSTVAFARSLSSPSSSPAPHPTGQRGLVSKMRKAFTPGKQK